MMSHQQASTQGQESSSTTSAVQVKVPKDIEMAENWSNGSSRPQQDPNVVAWNGPRDPENPHNWSTSRRVLNTSMMASMTWVVTFASSVLSSATTSISAEFGVSTEVATLGTSLFVLGFGVGPMVWGPLSELFGRMTPLCIAFTGFAIFQIPVAVAQNVETIMICRFWGGFFGVGPLAICAGAFADMWGPVDRGIAMALFVAATFVGPIMGPVMGGFITQSYLGWRWTAWITLIMACAFGLATAFVVPETYEPVLLKRRAQRIRQETKNWAIHAKIEEEPISLRSIAQRYILRPVRALVTELILLLVTIYMALIYGILYLFFEAYPVSFQEERGWNGGVGNLPFLSILVGVFAGSIVTVVNAKTRYARLHAESGGCVPPEERLYLMSVGSFVLPAGLFWFGWTSSPNISWVPQVLAGVPIGFGIFLIFLQGINYIVDAYLMYANSALAANTWVRSFFGAGFPLFAVQMYHKLGIAWASSLLGFLCVAMIPVPILFLKYGAAIRAKSDFTP